MSNRILVTGGTGFLGAYILKELIERNYTVRAIRRSSRLPGFIPAEVLDRVEWVTGDILDTISLEEAMHEVDTVIHAAAIVSFVPAERAEMYHVNVEGTANVVNIALDKQVRRMIHISSVAALGRTIGGGHVDESKKWEESPVNTHYARSKYKGELEVWRGVSEGLEAVILNPSTILGYGDWNTGSCAIFKNIYHEFKWYTSGINGFVDVKDVAKAVATILESPANEERFIVNGDNWPFRKLMNTIADDFGKKRPSRESGRTLLNIAWRLERAKSAFTGKRRLLTRESAKVGLSQTYFDNGKLLETFPGFRYTDLNETIRDATTQYLRQINA